MTRKEKYEWILENLAKCEKYCVDMSSRPQRDTCTDCKFFNKEWTKEDLSWCEIDNAKKYQK